MATATHSTKHTTYDHHRHKEKENRRPDGQLNSHHIIPSTGSNGSLPKRYQSVFTESTPLTSFGVRNDSNQQRSHSPPNHIQPQSHHRPLKPVKEFLTTTDQQIDDRWRSNGSTNGYIRSQTEVTVQNVNAALTKTLNKLRQEPLNTVTTNGRSTTSRPMTARGTSHQNTGTTTATSNFHYQLPGGTKGPLPAELITRRPISSNPSNGISHSRVSTGTGSLLVQQPISSTRHDIRSTDNPNMRISAPTKSLDTGLRQLDGFNFNAVEIDEYPDKSKKSNQASTTRKRSSPPRVQSTHHQQRQLPEVSVNPHIQSSVQRNAEQLPSLYEPIQNGISHEHIRSQIYENYYISNLNSGDRHTNHHHIQVEPTNTFKRTSSPLKHQQIADVQPTIIVQHQRTTVRPDSALNTHRQATKDPLNEAYIDRDNTTRAHLMTIESTQTNNDSSSTLKNYENQHEKNKNSRTSTSSPVTHEINRLWKKSKTKTSIRSTTGSLSTRKILKPNRPPCRLKNYGDETDTETTATETQSKDEDMARRHALPPSDLGSDVWSDLTSEFSDTKLRKHPNIRTSTPNMTRQSSSLSSKEVGQIRKQLTDLQIMYNDLLKLLDIDIESVRSSHKSSTSSQIEHHSRKHRFRKVMPVTSMRHSNLDMREINQRFTRLESSIVTLAESIAKLSAQIQTQRTIKDDVYQLRQEVSELRQQLHQNQHSRHQSSTPINTNGITSSISTTSQQQQSRLISANVQRVATANSTNPLNISTSYMPSTSTVQRSNSIIDPRQARKIEQFFGSEAMLRYFLSLLNYEEYAPVLEHEKIGFYELPYIGERKLQSLGIPYGPCARIIYEAQQYFISLLSLRSNGIDV